MELIAVAKDDYGAEHGFWNLGPGHVRDMLAALDSASGRRSIGKD